jgi:hypothetical protein
VNNINNKATSIFKSEKGSSSKADQNGSDPALGPAMSRLYERSYYLTIISRLPPCCGFELAIRKSCWRHLIFSSSLWHFSHLMFYWCKRVDLIQRHSATPESGRLAMEPIGGSERLMDDQDLPKTPESPKRQRKYRHQRRTLT